MGFFQEFREFAVKGNAIDLAVGVVIGAAFGRIVNSIVGDLIMPLIGFATGGVSFKDRYVALDGQQYESYAKAVEAKAPVLGYGNLLQALLEFLIVAFVLFVIVRQINSVRRRYEKVETVVVVPPKA
jgi:large conductance mechanosensitive channel